MSTITVLADVQLSDVFEEIDDFELLIELTKRAKGDKKYKLLNFIKIILGFNELAEKGDVIKKISEL